MLFTAEEIAGRVRGEIIGDGTTRLTGFASADQARAGDLTFADDEKYFAAAEQSAASAILVSGSVAASAKVLIRVPNPRIAVARLLPLFFPQAKPAPGVHPSASVAASAKLDASAHIGPHCAIGEGVEIGANTVLHGGNHIGRDAKVGADVELFPNVVLYERTIVGNRVRIHASTVIGSDGYGYVFDEGRHRKVLQVGNVVIGDDVEIGANSAVDRAALGSTVIGAGTKIDNLVHVAHNVVMGQHCLVMGQSGFAGSTQLGDYCVIASQSGVAGHLKLGRQSTVGAKSGVMRDVPDGGTVLGFPAMPDKQTKRQWIATQQLPDLVRKIRELQKQVAQLSAAQQG
jgi:UDP-3-O-[3-hydroxymyristoyl] glucosamine N-acyltransferase